MDITVKESILNSITGEHEEDYKIIVYPFGKYEIKVRLAADNTFIGIEEISINKSFVKYKQEAPRGYHDVDEFYK